MIWYFVSANLIINCQLLKYFLNVFLKAKLFFSLFDAAGGGELLPINL